MIINFHLISIIKQYLWKNVTLTGNFKEIVYLDHYDNIIPVFSESQLEDVGAVWLNSHAGAGHNDEFSILLVGDAIKCFIKRYGVMTSQLIKKYTATCNNVLLESMQGTEKPFVRISSEDELNDLFLLDVSMD